MEAVLLRRLTEDQEKIDTQAAVEELSRSSFIEVTESKQDRNLFLSLPLVSAQFGKRKLSVSPMKSAIEADTTLIQFFGAAQPVDIDHGVQPRVERMFRRIAERVSEKREEFENYRPMLEFIARKHPPAWLLLASLYEETATSDGYEQAKSAVQRYLEQPGVEGKESAWKKMAELCSRTQDWRGEAHAWVEIGQLTSATIDTVSTAANRLNAMFRDRYFIDLDTDTKEILFGKLVSAMERFIDECDAVDFSRLAWLCLHIGDDARAKEYTKLGLKKDPDDHHCLGLAERLAF
jgi:hypothetical protein